MIIKCNKYDLLQLPAKAGQIYYAADIRCLYQDYSAHKNGRARLAALVLNTEYERMNRIRPENGRNYYVVESNNLWVYDARWVLRDGDARRYNAYSYDANNGVSPVISNNDYITSSQTGDRIIDNNGLLGDGSVAIRDSNRIIKSVSRVDNQRNEISITSYLDNGITLYPYGLESSIEERRNLGALHLGIESEEVGGSLGAVMNRKGRAEYYGDLYVRGNVYTVAPANPFTYEISETPEGSSTMTHRFKAYKTDSSSGGVSYTIHNDFKVDVLSEDSANVTITTYMNDNNLAVTNGYHEMLYDGVFVWGSETVYEATRTINSPQNITYTLRGTEHEISFTLEGSPSSATVAFNNDEFSDANSNVYAQTELLNIYCLSSPASSAETTR